MIRIDTMADFVAARSEMESVYITSSTHGRVEVPCCNTFLVRRQLVVANKYNPNSVPSEKMLLLQRSILDNGFCFPIVAIWSDEESAFIIIDGFHRRLIGESDWLDFDYLPVVVLKHSITKRMVATIQFNKARGVHQVDMDADVIRSLIEQGLSEAEISERLGIDEDTVHRYKQLTGVAELFKNSAYSKSWEMVDEETK
jgi:ParB-like chromosome segregation protein Spo0J